MKITWYMKESGLWTLEVSKRQIGVTEVDTVLRQLIHLTLHQ